MEGHQRLQHRCSAQFPQNYDNAAQARRAARNAPDGPQGPSKEVKPGPILLQQRSGLPIIPVGIAAHFTYTFSRTWDKSEFPLPGSKIVLYYGEPIRNLSVLKRSEAIQVINQALFEADRTAQNGGVIL